jgi:hypothetical protein
MSERILIEVSETGARLVKRSLEDVGKGAEAAHKGVGLLKGALADPRGRLHAFRSAYALYPRCI